MFSVGRDLASLIFIIIIVICIIVFIVVVALNCFYNISVKKYCQQITNLVNFRIIPSYVKDEHSCQCFIKKFWIKRLSKETKISFCRRILTLNRYCSDSLHSHCFLRLLSAKFIRDSAFLKLEHVVKSGD